MGAHEYGTTIVTIKDSTPDDAYLYLWAVSCVEQHRTDAKGNI